MDIIPQKHCSVGNHDLPATSEYFVKSKRGKYGLKHCCKVCDKVIKAKYYQDNKEREQLKHKQYYQGHKEEHRIRTKRYNEKNADKIRVQRHEHYLDNIETLLAASSARYYANHEAELERRRDWRKKNRARLSIKHKKYYGRYPESRRAIKLRRRAREKGLPDNFTKNDWQLAVDYFYGCCAICGRQLNDLLSTHKAYADHWIPLKNPNCPGTIPTNIVPLCGGNDGCNSSKGSKDPVVWLTDRYGKRKANTILKRIQEYFDTLK
jgi:hypothetical protein